MKTAVVFVDVQRDFVSGKLGSEEARKKLPGIVAFAEKLAKQAASDKNLKLYATLDSHEKTRFFGREDSGNKKKPIAGYLASLEGKKLPVEHCVVGTDGWLLESAFTEAVFDKLTLVEKPTFGSFKLLDTIAADISDGPDKIVLCGFCTDICVVTNALMLRAKWPNAEIQVVAGLCAGTTSEKHEAALAVLESCQIEIV